MVFVIDPEVIHFHVIACHLAGWIFAVKLRWGRWCFRVRAAAHDYSHCQLISRLFLGRLISYLLWGGKCLEMFPNILFSVSKEERNKKIWTFKKLESKYSLRNYSNWFIDYRISWWVIYLLTTDRLNIAARFGGHRLTRGPSGKVKHTDM